MPCPKCSDTLKRCPDVQSSDCIKYVGENSACDIFCKGQSVSEVIEAIDETTCIVKTNTDVSGISIQDLCPEVRNSYNSKSYDVQNVVNFIDFLLSYDCVLQGQINTINNNLTTFSPIVKDVIWRCLSSNPCNIISTDTPLNVAIQNLVNTICEQNSRIEVLEAKVCEQQKSIQALTKSIECLIPKLNTLNVDLNFESCEPVVNPNPPC